MVIGYAACSSTWGQLYKGLKAWRMFKVLTESWVHSLSTEHSFLGRGTCRDQSQSWKHQQHQAMEGLVFEVWRYLYKLPPRPKTSLVCMLYPWTAFWAAALSKMVANKMGWESFVRYFLLQPDLNPRCSCVYCATRVSLMLRPWWMMRQAWWLWARLPTENGGGTEGHRFCNKRQVVGTGVQFLFRPKRVEQRLEMLHVVFISRCILMK